MRTKILILIAALVLGGVAAVLAARYLNEARTTLEDENEPIEVLVAKEDIPRGLTAEELISEKLIAIEEIPRRFVAADAVSSTKALEGQVLAVPLSAGEQVTRARFQMPDTAGLAYGVPEGYVAISIPVDEVTGVSGLIKPGDHVALIVHFDESNNEFDVPVARVVLKDAKVLAVAGSVTTSAETEDANSGGIVNASRDDSRRDTLDARAVTVAVTIEDAERIVFSEELTDRNRVWAVLLPATGEEIPDTAGTLFGNIFK